MHSLYKHLLKLLPEIDLHDSNMLLRLCPLVKARYFEANPPWGSKDSSSQGIWLTRLFVHIVQAVKYQPKNVQAWNVLGLCHTSMGDIGDGIAAYRKAIDLQPDHREAWANLAQARKEVT